MSWTLPARCETTAANLEKRAKLMGASFRVNEEPAPAADAAPPASDTPAAQGPPPEAAAPTPNQP
jgi:hypothetical protein